MDVGKGMDITTSVEMNVESDFLHKQIGRMVLNWQKAGLGWL